MMATVMFDGATNVPLWSDIILLFILFLSLLKLATN